MMMFGFSISVYTDTKEKPSTGCSFSFVQRSPWSCRMPRIGAWDIFPPCAQDLLSIPWSATDSRGTHLEPCLQSRSNKTDDEQCWLGFAIKDFWYDVYIKINRRTAQKCLLVVHARFASRGFVVATNTWDERQSLGSKDPLWAAIARLHVCTPEQPGSQTSPHLCAVWWKRSWLNMSAVDMEVHKASSQQKCLV